MLIKISATPTDGSELQMTMEVPDAELTSLPFDKLAQRYLEPAFSYLKNAAFQYDISSDTHIPVRSEEVIQSAAPAAPLTMAFNDALEQAKAGKKIRREGWGPAVTTWLEFNERMLPHLAYMPSVTVWQHCKEDMVARDWVVVA